MQVFPSDSPHSLIPQGVGKSSILLKYTTNEFKRDYNVTIGVEFGSKYIQLDADTRIKLQVWDTVSNENLLQKN